MKPVFFIACLLLARGSSEIGFPDRSQHSLKSLVIYLKDHSGVVMDFNVQRLSGNRVHLSWHTKPEKTGNGFEIERQLGKDAEFVKVGFVGWKSGQNATIIDYEFTDLNEYKDTSYYRLKQTDGKVTYYTDHYPVGGLMKTVPRK